MTAYMQSLVNTPNTPQTPRRILSDSTPFMNKLLHDATQAQQHAAQASPPTGFESRLKTPYKALRLQDTILQEVALWFNNLPLAERTAGWDSRTLQSITPAGTTIHPSDFRAMLSAANWSGRSENRDGIRARTVWYHPEHPPAPLYKAPQRPVGRPPKASATPATPTTPTMPLPTGAAGGRMTSHEPAPGFIPMDELLAAYEAEDRLGALIRCNSPLLHVVFTDEQIAAHPASRRATM
jgi:hypothetical protein